MQSSLDQQEKNKLLSQILWDYSIPVSEIEAVLKGEKEKAGHFTQESLFVKLLESYSWFTLLKLFTPIEIRQMLTPTVIGKLRSSALKQKYEFVRKRLQRIISVAG